MFKVTKTLLKQTNTYLSRVTDSRGKVEYFSTEIVVDNFNNYPEVSKEFKVIDDAIDFALNG